MGGEGKELTRLEVVYMIAGNLSYLEELDGSVIVNECSSLSLV